MVIGQESGQNEVDQNWLVFHRDVFSADKEKVGRVEVAFSLCAVDDAPGRWSVQPVAASPLVVFFPTVLSTNLGFLVQGPYRTTPSRDNIPRGDAWNQKLVKETSGLLVEAMRWLRDNAMLDTSALRCLPLDREKFSEGSMFAPLFDAVRQAFLDEPLLSAFAGGHIVAGQAKLARTQELRDLFSPEQVAALFDAKPSSWLTGDITQDRAPDIRQYLMRELGISEITPATLVPRLSRGFLEAQTDEWLLRLYEFLSGQESALRRRLDTVPLVRLNDGTHVVARENGESKAFLPSAIQTGFPTIRRAVCSTAEARNFLISLGITEPDPVDDVVWNVLPKYQKDEVDVDGDAYAGDIERIRSAFNTDSKTQREKLLSALRETSFVMVVDAGNGNGYVAKPGGTYIATERLKQLFTGVSNVFIVDDEYDCLRGEDVRDLLVACGASRYLDLEPTPATLSREDKEQIRREAGLERASWQEEPKDFALRGLTQLLAFLPSLAATEAKTRTTLLWDSLIDLEARGSGAFHGTYRWGYSHESKVARFDAAFVRRLREAAWVPDANGELLRPGLRVFDTLGWKPNPFLLSKLKFKPPLIDQLAKEAGIDPAALDLLRKLGITSVADLTSRLGITNPPPEAEKFQEAQSEAEGQSGGDVYDDAKDLYGDDMPDIPPGTSDPESGDHSTRGELGSGNQGRTGTGGAPHGGRQGSGHPQGSLGGSANSGGRGGGIIGGGQGKRSPGQAGGRPFISYVGAHPDEEEPDPDGLNQATRMQIEDQAISLVITFEPALRRTPEGNPGFDLYEADSGGQPFRWVEVKSMTGSLDDRPVGLSHTQFDYAQKRGAAYWLYVVEYATDPEKAQVLRIQDPVAHARTFTFDRGWRQIAQPPD